MELRKWMKTTESSATQLARRANVEVSSITRYLKGERGLGKKTAMKISAATVGAVTLVELLYPEGVLDGARFGGKK